jgi:hypothetical protein
MCVLMLKPLRGSDQLRVKQPKGKFSWRRKCSLEPWLLLLQS